MLFNSYLFIFIFLPITFSIYFLLAQIKLGRVSILGLSLLSFIFYSFWEPEYFSVILTSILVNYCSGLLIQKKFWKTTTCTIAIVFNVFLLLYYKYTIFLIHNFNVMFNQHISVANIMLPLGISFFTFTQIAFIIDCYKNKVKEVNFLNYILFVTFFPHLLAGPIIHHAEMMPQFASADNKKINFNNIYNGLCLFSLGLFKKTVIADFFAFNVGQLFNQAKVIKLTFWDSWVAALGYSVQLYFDFSGYTDMALGIALLFNILLPINFNSPYKASSISDFWKRWHITLSRFLRDYIYIPLGGSRCGYIRREINVLLVFLIGGAWHGAGWTFIIWGMLHALGYIISRAWNILNLRILQVRIPKVIYVIITFLYVTVCWVFFNSVDISTAKDIILSMFAFSVWGKFNIYLLPIGLMIIIAMVSPNSNQIVEYTSIRGVKYSVIYAFILGISLIAINLIPNTPFIYFQF